MKITITVKQIQEKINILKSSGLLRTITNEKKLINAIIKRKSVYLGIDPTGISLHLGHLAPITLARELSELGCPVIILIGGYTAQIGEPKLVANQGKNQEIDVRNSLSADVVAANTKLIEKQITTLFPDKSKITIVNNLDWWKNKNVYSFFKDVGSKFTINKLLERKSMKGVDELSFSRLSYILFQAYDFFYLATKNDCAIQIGGQDQAPNIMLGLDLAKSLIAEEVNAKPEKIELIKDLMCGITTTLFEDQKGVKISKTMDGKSFTLDLPLFTFYQEVFNFSDVEASQFLKYLLPGDKYPFELSDGIKSNADRHLQKKLAAYLIGWVFPKKINSIAKMAILTETLSSLKTNFTTSGLNLQAKENLINLLPEITINNHLKKVTIWEIMDAWLGFSKSKTSQMLEQSAIKFHYFSITTDDSKTSEIDKLNFDLKILFQNPKPAYSELVLPSKDIFLLVAKGKNQLAILSFNKK